jgi:hypothetical protein
MEPEQCLSLYRDMLAANAFGHETEGASLALDERSGEILLTRRLELADATVSQLRRVVEGMVDVAVNWRGKLDTLGHAEPALSIAAKPKSVQGRPDMRA